MRCPTHAVEPGNACGRTGLRIRMNFYPAPEVLFLSADAEKGRKLSLTLQTQRNRNTQAIKTLI